jgi:hypothetical protein
MWIILGLFLSTFGFALDSIDRINEVKILRILPDNIVLLNRGLEDGIARNDHAKLTNEVEGYGSRALCLRVAQSISYWKLYRIPNSEAFSKDYVYTLVGMADKEIPYSTEKLRDEVQKFVDPEDKTEKKDLGPDPFLIKSDLPQRITERDLLGPLGPEKRRLFIEKVLDRDRLSQDLSAYRFSLYASPFTRQSINQGESLRYGFRGGNVASKYRLLTQFEQQQTKLQDPLTKAKVSTRNTSGQVQFVIHRLGKSISSLSLINYNSQRFSDLGTPKAHWQVGVIGFSWHLYESKTWEYLDLSYIPLYDMRTTEILKNNTRSESKQNGLRHGFRFGMKTKINDKVAFENLLWVRLYQDLSNWRIEEDNLNLVNDLKLIFNLTDRLFFDYNFVYQKDKLWRTLSNLPDSNSINSLNLRYDFDI